VTAQQEPESKVDRLYLVTRADLPFGAKAAQLLHAFREFVREHAEIEKQWYLCSNTIVCLEAEDRDDLVMLIERAIRRGIPHSVFREPDLSGEITAAAFAPSGALLCRNLRLLGS
jgi:peptidyl-tRNA hydrolase